MDKIEMSEKDLYIKKIKNLAITPEDYIDGKELLKLMNYYGVNGLSVLTLDQLKEYYERATKTSTSGTT